MAVLSLSLLLFFQILHIWDGSNISSYIYKSLLHREEYAMKPIFSAGKITLSVIGEENKNSSLSVLINGEVHGKFVHKQMELIVRDHDIISIEGATANHDGLQFKVVSTTNNVLFPQVNNIFKLDHIENQLFTVEFH